MPRKLRIQYPGAMYHVMNRGDQREAIFGDDVVLDVAAGRRRKAIDLPPKITATDTP
jgi:hypothetical protein